MPCGTTVCTGVPPCVLGHHSVWWGSTVCDGAQLGVMGVAYISKKDTARIWNLDTHCVLHKPNWFCWHIQSSHIILINSQDTHIMHMQTHQTINNTDGYSPSKTTALSNRTITNIQTSATSDHHQIVIWICFWMYWWSSTKISSNSETAILSNFQRNTWSVEIFLWICAMCLLLK